MTKQEQIEKMANCSPCYERYGKCPLKDKTTCNRWTRAVNQYEQGYRKIPEEAVVLTKEECEHKVILDEDHFERALNYEREKARKETAKEFAEKLKEKARGLTLEGDKGPGFYIGNVVLTNDIDKLLKEYEK